MRAELGIDAQRATIIARAAAIGATIIAEYVEVESGKRSDRPQLSAAVRECRATGADLICAKVDRLARDARFLLTLIDGMGRQEVEFCDMPTLPRGPMQRFMLTQLASMAELERGLIAERTRAALQAARQRGVKLGGARDGAGSPDGMARARAAYQAQASEHAARVMPYIEAAKRAGAVTTRDLAAALTARGAGNRDRARRLGLESGLSCDGARGVTGRE